MVALLEEELCETELHQSDKGAENTTEISSYVSCIKCGTVLSLKDRSVQSVHYDPNNSARLLTVHTSVCMPNNTSAYLLDTPIHFNIFVDRGHE